MRGHSEIEQQTSPEAALGDQQVDLDVLGGTPGWYFRVIELQLSRDLARRVKHLEPIRGKGRITALLLIDRQPHIRASILSEVMLLDRSAVARILDGLESAGLIRRSVAPGDNRVFDLSVTPAGARIAETLRGIVTRQSDDFFACLSPQEHDILLDILRRTYARLREARA